MGVGWGGLGTRSGNASSPAKGLAELTCWGHGPQCCSYQGGAPLHAHAGDAGSGFEGGFRRRQPQSVQ